jgi:hypothetical protein
LAEVCSSQKLSNLPAGIRGWDGTDSLFSFRAKPALPLRQVKTEVFDSVLANMGLFPRDFVSCFPYYKRKEKALPFHSVLLSWSSQQEVIYILEEYAAVLVC